MVKFIDSISKNILNPIKDIFTRLSELREVKRIEKQRTITVLYPDDNNILQETQGKLSQNLEWLYLPLFNRLDFVDKIYRDSKLRPIVFTTLRQHKTIDLNEANDETIEFYNEAKKIFLKTPKKVHITTDLKIKDNPISHEFSIDAHRVFSTKSLEVLEEPARRTILIVFVFGFLVGICLTFIIAYGLALWMK